MDWFRRQGTKFTEGSQEELVFGKLGWGWADAPECTGFATGSNLLLGKEASRCARNTSCDHLLAEVRVQSPHKH